jgi:hypothetical protein
MLRRVTRRLTHCRSELITNIAPVQGFEAS